MIFFKSCSLWSLDSLLQCKKKKKKTRLPELGFGLSFECYQYYPQMHGLLNLLWLGCSLCAVLPPSLWRQLASPALDTHLRCNGTVMDNSSNSSLPELTAKQRRRLCASIPQAVGSLFLLVAAAFLFGFIAGGFNFLITSSILWIWSEITEVIQKYFAFSY